METVDIYAPAKGEIWNLFHSLMYGYRAFICRTNPGKEIWMIPPANVRFSPYYLDMKALGFLSERGLAWERTLAPSEKGPAACEAVIELTPEGVREANMIESRMFSTGASAFFESHPYSQIPAGGLAIPPGDAVER